MHEKIKLVEAEYFLNQMVKLQGDYLQFTFNLSAFLSATSSVVYFMEEELKDSVNEKWLVEKKESKLLRFFKFTRNLNNHMRPCRPAKDVTLMVPVTVISTTLGGVAITSSGTITTQPNVPALEIPKVEAKHNYRFDENFFNETSSYFSETNKQFCKSVFNKYDVLTFSNQWLKELEEIVNEAISKKYISG